VKRLVREKGKGECLLGVFGNTKSGRGQNFDAGKRGGELRKDQRIERATARNDELVNFRFAQNETIQGVNDRERGENGHGPNEVVRFGAMAPAEREDFLHIGVAVVFAARGFGRRDFQVRIAQEFVKERWIAAALRGELRVFVKALVAAREVRNQGVDEHVRWPRVEGEYLLRLGRARKNGDVGDAAEIQRNTAQSRVAVEKIIHIRNERRALPAKSHVSGGSPICKVDAVGAPKQGTGRP